MYQPIRWGYQDASGRQREADGGRLVNLFPVETPDPVNDKVPADLWNTPGAEQWMSLPQSGDITLQRRIPLGFDLAPNNDIPRGQWSDGTTLWVANAGPNLELFAYTLLTRMPDPSKNIILGTTRANLPTGVTGKEQTIWVAFNDFTNIRAYSTVSLARDATMDVSTTQEDIVALWVENDDILWVLSKSGQVIPYALPGFTPTLPDAFSLPSDDNDIRTLRGATRLADDSIAIINGAAPDIFGNNVRPGGRDEEQDFDFKSEYPVILNAFGFVNDSTNAYMIDANTRTIYVMNVAAREGNPDRNISLPEDGFPYYMYGEGNSLWVLIIPPSNARPYVIQFNSQTKKEGITLTLSSDVIIPRGLFATKDHAFIADKGQNKILCFTFGSVTVGHTVTTRPTFTEVITEEEEEEQNKNIVLPSERDKPKGIWVEGENVFVLDSGDAVIYGYFRGDSNPNAGIDFDLGDEPDGIDALGLWGNSRHFYLLRPDKIETYERDGGDMLSLLTITLDPLNADPRGVFATANHVYVLDNAARKIFTYRWSAGGRFGQRNSALDKTPGQLLPGVGMEKPVGIAGAAGRAWILGEDTGIYEIEADADGVFTRVSGGADIANIPGNDSNDLAVYEVGGNLRMLWADDANNAIYAADMTGAAWGAPRSVISPNNPHGVAVDDNYIYTTDDGREIIRFDRETFARDSWSISLSAHNIKRRARALFAFNGRLWMVAHETMTAYAFDIESRETVTDLYVSLSAGEPRSIWGDGRYLYITDDRDSETKGGIQGYYMSSTERDPPRDVDLHADNDDAYGLFATATTFYVGNRGMNQNIYAYDLFQRSYIEDGGFPLAEVNSQAQSIWGRIDGIYVLDLNGTAYWYSFQARKVKQVVEVVIGEEEIIELEKELGLIRDPAGDIPLHVDNSDVTGIWSDGDRFYVANARPSAIFVYDVMTKDRLPEWEFPLDPENIDNFAGGVWGNDRCLWVGGVHSGKAYCYLRFAGSGGDSICPLTQRNASPYGIWADAMHYYVNDEATGYLYVYDQDGCQLALSADKEDFISNATPLAMVAIDSPINGKHLFGVSQDTFFHFNPGPPFNDTAITHTGMFSSYAEEQLQSSLKLVTDNHYVIILTPISIKIYDVLTRDLIEDATLPTPSNLSKILHDEDWVAAAWSDGYFLVGTRSGEVFHSNLRTLKFDQLDFTRTEAYPDSLVGMEVYNRQVVLFGDQSIEQWYNSGGDPVFRRNYSLSVNVGAAAQAAISVDIEGILFLATNGIVYHYPGMSRVSSLAVEESIKQSDKSKATSYVYTEEGQRFYVLTLDINGTKKTWTMHIDTRLWHERTITNVRAYAEFLDKHIVSRSSGLDEMSTNLGSDHGMAIARQSIIPALQFNRARYRVHALEVEIPFRTGGDVADTIALDWSEDGGDNFGPMPSLSQPIPPDARARAKWTRLGGGDRTRNFRLSINATRPVNVLSAYMDIEVDEA